MKTLFTCLLAAILCHPIPLAAQSDATDALDDSDLRFEFLREFAEQFEFRLGSDDSPVMLEKSQPLLHYSNPVRNSLSDGCTFLWLDKQRPCAAQSISIRGSGRVFWEASSLVPEPLSVSRSQKIEWTPSATGLYRQPFIDSPSPASNRNLRLVQMRRLARRFSGRYNDTTELRTMPQPIHRFEHLPDEPMGTVDGAVFVLAEATDPEALLTIEAVRMPDGMAQWHYSLARMSSQMITVTLDGQQVLRTTKFWQAPGRDLPYAEVPAGTFPPPALSPLTERADPPPSK